MIIDLNNAFLITNYQSFIFNVYNIPIANTLIVKNYNSNITSTLNHVTNISVSKTYNTNITRIKNV